MDSTEEGPIDPSTPVILANKLLRQCNSWRRVQSVEDISSTVLADLYAGFLAEQPQGLISDPITREDEIQNCQTIIDQLATNLHTSLSHIRGRSIVEGDVIVVQNLLEIIAMLADIILNKIDSDISTDFDDTRTSSNLPPNDVTDELNSREVRWEASGRSLATKKQLPEAKNGHGRVSPKMDRVELRTPPTDFLTDIPASGTSNVLFGKTSSLLDRANNLLKSSKELKESHLRSREHFQPRTTVKENTWVSPDSDDKLVREESRPHSHSPVYQKSTNRFEYLGVRPKVVQDSAMSDGKEAKGDKSSDFSATYPLPKSRDPPEDDKFRATVGIADYKDRYTAPTSTEATATSPVATTTTTTTHSSRPLAAKGLASSYNDLHSLVTQTAAYVRAAVRTSPVRSKREHDALSLEDYRTEHNLPHYRPSRVATAETADHRVPHTRTLTVEDRRLARDLNVGPTRGRIPSDLTQSSLDFTATSPGARKVSFLDSSSDFGSREVLTRGKRDRLSSDEVATIRVDIHHRSGATSQRPATIPQSAREKYGSFTDIGYLSDNEVDNSGRDEILRKRYQKIMADVLGDGDKNMSSNPSGSRPVNKQVRFQSGKKKTSVLKVAEPRRVKKKAQGPLLDTRKHLLKENKSQKKKTEILKKMYNEDLEDLEEEYKDQLNRHRKETKETDTEFKKKVQKKPKTRNLVKKSEVVIGAAPSRKSQPRKVTIGSKVRKHSTGSVHTAKRALSLSEEEDLLPVLLEEFPHLYLSEHTWHELWRRGIRQIEQVTRTYEESKRKKSVAQAQIELAEKKHDILVNMVKKQLEHTKRLQDIKDQRSQQASVQNKLHDKRIQSARARKYYNEYQVRMRAKMLKRRTKEEMIFKKVFDECLSIQKERIREVRKYAREQRVNHAEQRSNEIHSMENYYKDQFNMLAERISQERKDMAIREKAQQKILTEMKKDMRNRMESEIHQFQEQMFRDEDDAYFRQLDADRLQQNLHLAKFQTRV